MARKKFLDEAEDQQENVGIKSYQNKKNHFASSPPRSGSVLGLGLINPRGRSNQKLNNPNNGSSLSPEDSLYSVIKQLSNDGLTIREMPGDGNCLFRALGDQLEGNTRNHIHHRRAVVQYMRENRSDFEPFVEDDQPFDKYVQSLSQPGTFAGNDAIVAFARLYNVTVVIHQLNSPAWLIHPTTDGRTVSSGREVHIAYHNGDHYNSVRKIGDDSDAPAEIRFISQQEPVHNKPTKNSKPKLGTTNSKNNHSPTLKSSTVTSDQSKSPDLLFNDNHYNEYWVNDTGDIDNLVDKIVRETCYPDPIVVRQALVECNFDMVVTLNLILSLVMSQSDTTEPPPTQPTPVGMAESPLVNQEIEALALNKNKVRLELDTGIGVSNSAEQEVVGESPNNQSGVAYNTDLNTVTVQNASASSSPVPSASQVELLESSTTEDEDLEIAEAGPVPKAKFSNRQKQEKKKQDRKRNRNLERRAKANNSIGNGSETSPLQYSSSSSSSSGLRSLNI